MKMMINGKYVDAKNGATIDIVNSATQEHIDTVPAATEDDVNAAIEAAKEGAKTWGATPQYKRSEILFKCAEAIEKNVEELARSLSTEMGKVISEALPEVACSAQIFRGFAEMANHLYGQVMPEFQKGSETDIIFTKREPLGVVACITPFNYPVELCYHKVAASLAMGNTVIIKPASDNPLTVMKVAKLCWEAGVPGNVLQLVTGSGASIGKILSTSKDIDAISLTGSTEVGVQVAELAAKTLKHLHLELGGNDPLVIFEDADMDLAVDETVYGRLKNAGQTCCSPKRFIVHSSIAEEYTKKVIEKLKTIKTGCPLDKATELGSLINPRAAEDVKKQVEHTLSQGAKCVYGGKLYDKTYFEPTVLTGVTKDMDIAVDLEVFGPVFPIITFDTFDEAVEIANNTIYGLQGGVITKDVSKAIRAASQIRVGGIVINGSGNYRNIDQPFGGMKMSGLGREGVCCTLQEMTQVKSYIMKNIMV
ncbi:MAG: aldehyde dehydrogenase family protein [Defluviitaleaceae bacterium]|nr:aldehyde dehydrogenase family protein [Defluviitaleaceae bacterium]